jgi:predicted phage terminase large subunit-like protein
MPMLATPDNLRLVDALVRSDFQSFIQKVFRILSPNVVLQMNFHVWALAHHLELVRRGKIKRLIVNLPPRTLKSLITSVAFPAFALGQDPSKRFIVVSYGSDLAVKLNNDFRVVINYPGYQQLFPLMRTDGAKNTESEVATTQGGYRLAVSIDGALTGRGGDVLIVDDPLKPSEALNDSRRQWVNSWFSNTLLSRLDDMANGAVIVVMQRLHDDDLTGALLRSPEHWVHLKLPAIAETEETIQTGAIKPHIRRMGDILHSERMPRTELEARRTIDPETFAAHYQQAPIRPGGIIIKRAWVHYYDELPLRNPSSIVLQSWDCASKLGDLNDWSVCTTWLIQDGQYYLIDVLRERLDYPGLKTRAVEHARNFGPNKIVVEDVGVGSGLIADLSKTSLPVVAVKPEGNKKTRMQIQSAKFEAGLVFFPRRAPWLADYEAELFGFPNVRFDDQVDSTSQALTIDPSGYDPGVLAKGMGNLVEGLMFHRMFPW